jgi:DAK2 domain fusion protein YloV
VSPVQDALQQLAPADLRRIVATYRDVLRAHQDELNRLNVYPVPDGDTGTNMALTVESVVGELDDAGGPAAMEPAAEPTMEPAAEPTMEQVCEAIRHGSLMGARGNSGVILSQILRGLADTFAPLESVSAGDVAEGLRRAADAAYEAVLRPVEGTILTVVRSAAESVEQAVAEGEATLTGLFERATAAAHDAVASTPDLLPVLREAGVVDAGGRGFELLLAACRNVVDGTPVPAPLVVNTPESVEMNLHHRHDEMAGGRYEVMFLLAADDDRVPGFKDAWDGLGDSIVVVGGDGLWNCHVHTDDIGGAVEAGIAVGTPSRIHVTDLVEQVSDLEEQQWVRDREAPSRAAVATAVVAVAVGDGLRRLLGTLGVQEVVAGGQSMNPSTAQILDAVRACDAQGVIVLPNNKNIVPVARQVPALTDIPVEVVPTGAAVEALSALVVYDPDRSVAENVAAMAEGAARVRAGEVTQAVRDSVAECGPIREGDWIAITREGIVAAVGSAPDAAVALFAALIDDDSELVTVLVGEGASDADVAALGAHLGAAYPDVEVELHQGDQPLYPFLIGVE